MTACLAVLACEGATAQPGTSQVVDEMETPERLAVFLDCGFCDETFIRQEMTYVDYVRDREVAHVHVLVTHENRPRSPAGTDSPHSPCWLPGSRH